MRPRQLIGILNLLLLPLGAYAGHQVCGNQEVPAGVRKCPDGSLLRYVADEVKPYVRPQAAQESVPTAKGPDSPAADASNLNYYFGVWRTRIPGAVWTSPSGYQGYDWLHVSAGVSTGDLIIRPDGTYVWQSYGGKSGNWVRGEGGYPIVLIDTVEKRRWKVGADPRHTGGRDIIVWDGNAIYYDGRK